MKKVLLLLCCTFCLNGISQIEFSPPGAEWTYLFNNYFKPPIFTKKIIYIKDTVINNDTLKILAGYINKNDNDCYHYSTHFTVVRQKGDTIWFKNIMTNNTWQILYNFATPVGQSWGTTVYPSIGPAKNYVVLVDSVSTKIINGIPLKHLAVRYFGGPNGIEKTHVTEKLGCNLFMLNYYTVDCLTDQPYFREFICYKDDELGLHQVTALPCDYYETVDINEASESNNNKSVLLYPLPVADFLFLKNLSPEIVHATLSDITGTFIMQFLIAINEETRVSVKHLSEGLYILKLHSANKVMVQKLVICK